jgi:protocatechuate 3,4-dioxygenase beta subunit
MITKINLALFFVFFSLSMSAQVTGVVYRDFNGDGSRQTSAPNNEPGVAGVVINAYNSSNSLVQSVTSAGDGSYSITASLPLRLEYVIPAGLNCVNSLLDYNGFSGDGNNVRLVTTASTQNFAVNFVDQYTTNTNPKVYVPMYIMGNPLGSGTASTQAAFWSYDYNSSTTPANSVSLAQSQLGTVWGVAYSKQAKKVFTSAFIKRHSGLGPLGSGGIYMLDGTTLSKTNFYDLDANGIRTRAASGAVSYGDGTSFTIAGGTTITYLGPTDAVSGFPEGLGVIGDNVTNRLLPDNMNADAYDPAAFDQVGKAGLGDLDISDDGKFLFVMNLYSRSVVRLELDNAYNPTSVVSATSYPIPNYAVTNGVLRPFAVQYYRGKVYIGTVASGENAGTLSDLFAHVFELNDPVGSATFNTTPILSIPLNYKKGYPMLPMNSDVYKYWKPWSNNSANVHNLGEQAWSTPILSNLEFTDRGDMILDFMDRGGHQYGYNTYLNLNSTASGTAMYDVSGDVLIAGRDCNTGGWTLESNGSYNSDGTTYTSAGAGNTEGPGGGEFYYLEIPPDDYHHETSQGAAAVVHGTETGIFTLMDANAAFSGGTAQFNNYTANATNRLTLYGSADGFLSKANGLGDIEVAGDEPPIEVGNLVWNDANYDGLQTAGELGISGVTVELFCDFDNNDIPDGAAIGSTTTDGNGYWYFNNANVIDGDCGVAGNQTGLQLNKKYLVRIGSTDWTAGVGAGDLTGMLMAASNSPTTGLSDASDNDASLISSIPTIGFTTTNKLGENNHSYDFGFHFPPPCTVTASVVSGSQFICSSEDPVAFTETTPASGNGTLSYQWQSSTTNCSSGFTDILGANGTTYDPPANLTITTYYHVVVTNDDGFTTCTATSNCITVTVNSLPTADAGSTQNLDCTTTSATIGTSAIGGNTYSWSPATGLSSTTIAQPTASPSSTTVYTVTVTGSNGCTATSTVTVNVNTTTPTADAGSTQNLDCTTTSATIGTSAIGGNTYSWSPATGLSSTTIAQPTASPTSTTVYTVTVTGSNGCTATSTVTVNVNTTAPTADAGSTQNLDCTTTSATIGTSAIGGNTYSWSPATGLSSTTIAQPTASPSTTTVYTVTVTGSNGCTATSTVTVNVNTTVPTADAGSTQNLDCTTTSATIGTSAIGGNTYSWSPATGLSSTTIAQPTASPSSTTVYTVTVTGSNGCTATSTVTVNVNTTTPTADAGSTQNLDCITTSATIGTSAIGGNTYSWSPATGLSSTTIAQPTASPSSTTVYTVTVTGSNGCTATSTVTVDVNTTAPTVVISGSTVVCNGSTTTLTASGASTYVWSNTDITPSTTVGVGTYTVTGTASNGCTATSTVDVINQQGSIGNYVWEDLNKNGLNDELAMNGINGVAVELWKETAPTSGIYAFYASTTTADDGGSNPGYYNFPICENANYQIHFPSIIGSLKLTNENTTPNTDNNSDANPISGLSPVIAIDVTSVGVSKDNMTIDAGYYSKAQLGNYVWNDLDHDGEQDANEVGVAGIAVTLYNQSNEVVSTTLTDAYGYYKFNPLDPGQYYVGFSLPANYEFTLQNTVGDLVDNDVNPITGLTGNYTLLSGDSNMSVDAGIYFVAPTTATVGNFVWYDTDKDGVQDAGEQGISGVVVTLYNSLNQVVASMLTDANGFYLFTDVTPGTYTVGFTLKPGLVFSPNNNTIDNPSNSDANLVTGITSSFIVLAGDNITYVDAGMYNVNLDFPLLGGLGDRVWYDTDQDGVQDEAETGVQGVLVTLYQSNGTTVISTTTTNAFGYYVFNALPAGQYVVGFSDLPLNYTLTTNTALDSVTNSDANPGTGKTNVINLGNGQYNMTYDAGIYNTLPTNTNSIGDYVWNDVNKNGIQEPSEIGVSGVTVTLYNASNVPISSTSTDASGYYHFPDLPNGTFYVGFSNLPTGYVFSPQGNGTASTDSDPNPANGLTASVTLVGNTHITDLDAGINIGNTKIGLGSLGDLVWYDLNNNGLQDANELGVQEVTVTLYESDGTTVISTTTTNALGYYIFTSLEAGSYVVGFSNLPSGFVISPKDADAEGLNGELNSDVNSLTQKTDLILLGTGEDKMSVDMGIVPPTGTASLGNLVWFDLNNDGLQTSGEPGVQGVTVSLYNAINEVVSTTTTNALGEYYFVGLVPATYSVGFSNLPEGYTMALYNSDLTGINGAFNSDADPVSGLTTTVTLSVGENNPNLDAGIVSTIVASVGDYVWFDADHDGLQDPSEQGVGGVLVTLYDNTNTPVASTITDANGGYIFTNVTPGSYTIGFSNIPVGMEFTQEVGGPSDNDNSNVNPSTGLTASFTVVAGTHNPTIDAGLTTPQLCGLGNYVWIDTDKDGLQDPTESGVAGVLVRLYASDLTTILATTTTDGSGQYSFTSLPAGTYAVGFSNLPNGYTRTLIVGSINDVSNSDMHADGKTNAVTLVGGEYNPNLDAGIYFGFPLPALELKATVAIIKENNLCDVNWFTREEQNTSRFEIERSIDGVNFEKVGSHLASGNTTGLTNYDFSDNIDAVSNQPILYYRIKLIDVDGKYSYSNTISVKPNENQEQGVSVYPVPFINEIWISYQSLEEADVVVELTDLSGRVLTQKSMQISKGSNQIHLAELQSLAAANYVVRIKNLTSGDVYIRKVLK